MNEPVIVDAIRSPVARYDGRLNDVRPDHMSAYLIRTLIRSLELDPAEIEELIFGCVTQVGEQSQNIGRNSWLATGFPVDVPAFSLTRQCGSSQTAVNLAATQIAAGVNDVVLAGGVEHMTRVPMASNMEMNGDPYGPWNREHYRRVNQGISAELIAEEWGLSRQELDEFSYQSHIRAADATGAGHFDRELVPLPVHMLSRESVPEKTSVPAAPNGSSEDSEEDWFEYDDGIRYDPDLDSMHDLDTVFKDDGVVTAGNASQISDGASLLLIMSREKAESLGYEPRARIRAQKSVGVDPTIMLTGPIPATREILNDEGMTVDDIDLFEVNEAFASVVLAWQRELDPDMDKVNVNGGAIALGHPLGATGGKLMTTLLHELERRDVQIGLQTMCCGGGLGVATIIDRDV